MSFHIAGPQLSDVCVCVCVRGGCAAAGDLPASCYPLDEIDFVYLVTLGSVGPNYVLVAQQDCCFSKEKKAGGEALGHLIGKMVISSFPSGLFEKKKLSLCEKKTTKCYVMRHEGPLSNISLKYPMSNIE